jgi:cytochrome c oxidase subunit 3
MATTTLPPGADITLNDCGSGKPPELTPRPGYVAQSGSSSQKSETGMLVAVSAIGMSFAAFTSAMFVRQDSSTDWQHFQLPYVLYLNTVILIGSSVTLQLSRQRFAAIPQAAQRAVTSVKVLLAGGIYWLYLTAALGLIFVLGQILAWRNLAAQGLFLATNPSSSFFYLFTALHAAHLLGGMGGLFYVLRKLIRNGGVAESSGLSAFSIYWHFMDLLWVYLLLLLAIRM